MTRHRSYVNIIFIMKLVGETLRQKERSWSWLSRKTGIEQSVLSRLKNDKRPLNKRYRAKISAALQILPENIRNNYMPEKEVPNMAFVLLALRNKKLTWGWLSHNTGISKYMIRKLRSGTEPNTEQMESMSKALNIPMEELFIDNGDTEEAPQGPALVKYPKLE